jgi:hypothetical protein
MLHVIFAVQSLEPLFQAYTRLFAHSMPYKVRGCPEGTLRILRVWREGNGSHLYMEPHRRSPMMISRKHRKSNSMASPTDFLVRLQESTTMPAIVASLQHHLGSCANGAPLSTSHHFQWRVPTTSGASRPQILSCTRQATRLLRVHIYNSVVHNVRRAAT